MFDNDLWEWLHTSDEGALWRAFTDAFCLVVGVVAVGVLLLFAGVRLTARRSARRQPLTGTLEGKETIGFFHPYCAAGGGGERVLWCAVHAVQTEHPDVHCVVYTGDEAPAAEMVAQAASRFGVALAADRLHFVRLFQRRWVEAATWPRFTLLGQSFGSIVLAFEALSLFLPDSFVDSMGYAFTYPLVWCIGHARIGCYVHYPTISTDMLERVRTREVGVCNNATVAASPLRSLAKWLYYRAFAIAYGFVGGFAEVVLVNSSWTLGHLLHLWGDVGKGGICLVYPPCDTSKLADLPLQRSPAPHGGHLVVSLAQFRPEKDHPLQLRAFARFLREGPPERRQTGAERVRLVLVGGVRDEGDQGRLDALLALCDELGLRRRSDCSGNWDVDFRVNLPLDSVQELLGQATVGLHTMREEHFGISVVEFMAAGAVVLAHDSGGPAKDIVRTQQAAEVPTGFLATDEVSYATALQHIFALGATERQEIASAARASVIERFSQEAFEQAFLTRVVAQFLK